MDPSLVALSADIIKAQAGFRVMSPEELTSALEHVFHTLNQLHHDRVDATDEPDDGSQSLAYLRQHPLETVQRDWVICLECGKPYRLLSNRHLAQYGLTPRTYKQKWSIPLSQALSADSLTKRRRKMAKKLGMGKGLARWRAQRYAPAAEPV